MQYYSPNTKQLSKEGIEFKLIDISNKTRNSEQKYTKSIFDKHRVILGRLKAKIECLENDILEKDKEVLSLRNELSKEKSLREAVYSNKEIEDFIKNEFQKEMKDEILVKIESFVEKKLMENQRILEEIKNVVVSGKIEGRGKVKNSDLEEKIAKLEEENKNLKGTSNLNPLRLRVKELEEENREIKKNNQTDTVVLLQNKIKELTMKLEESKKIKKSSGGRRRNNFDSSDEGGLILPETTIIKDNPYEKSFIKPKAVSKSAKNPSKRINVKKLIDNSNKSYFNDLSFGASSPFTKKKK